MSREAWAKARADELINGRCNHTESSFGVICVDCLAAALCEVAEERDKARSEVDRLNGLRQQLDQARVELAEAREQMQRVCDGGDVFFLEQWLTAHKEPK